jgi:orotate phosphoribosyltransferase
MIGDHPTLLDEFRACGAWLEGHFRLSSGLHSGGYLQSALVLQHPSRAAALGERLAAEVRGSAPTVVLSPALGGLIIGHEVARALGTRAIFAERQDGRLTLRRGFRLEPDDRVLVVEDVVTTGLSTRETVDVARTFGASVVGAAAIVDRSDGSPALDVPFVALLTLQVPAWQEAECPLCAQGLPLVKPGSRPSADAPA